MFNLQTLFEEIIFKPLFHFFVRLKIQRKINPDKKKYLIEYIRIIGGSHYTGLPMKSYIFQFK